MTNRQEIAYQVSVTLGDHVDDYDVDAIVTDLINNAPSGQNLPNIDAIDSEDYWAIVRRHDTTEACGEV